MKYREFAAAIRKGHTMIRERKDMYLTCSQGCALGAMWVGMGKTEAAWGELYGSSGKPPETLFAEQLGIPLYLSREISAKHHSGMPRLEIADWLDSLEPRETHTDYTKRVLAEIVNGVETSVERKINATAE